MLGEGEVGRSRSLGTRGALGGGLLAALGRALTPMGLGGEEEEGMRGRGGDRDGGVGRGRVVLGPAMPPPPSSSS